MTQIKHTTASMAALAAALAAPLVTSTAMADERLHPVEAVCIEYEQTGVMSGTSIECHRNWGHEAYRIEDFSMSVMGMSQSHNQHSITLGDRIISWDRDTRQGTETANPMYERMVGASRGSIDDYVADMTSAMGFSRTGEVRTISGESCTVWRSRQMGAICFTPDFLVLDQVMGSGMAGFERRATSIRRGDGGDPDNYRVPDDVTIGAARSMGGLFDRM